MKTERGFLTKKRIATNYYEISACESSENHAINTESEAREMQQVFANNFVPKGRYICLNCSKEFVAEKRDYLRPCEECGCTQFRANIILQMSEEELKEKCRDVLRVLEIATFLFEEKGRKEFLNVMAINLRLLLCDGENSLLPKVYKNPRFDKANVKYKDHVLLPKDLFFNELEQVDLETFLNTVIAYPRNSRPITVKKCIRSVANKLGGAHVDSEMESDAFLSGTLAKYYITEIAKYVIAMCEFDYQKDIGEFLDLMR